MSTASLEALVREQRALIAALDADDVEAIGRHTDAMNEVLLRIRALGPRFAGTGARTLVEESLVLADAARVRINVLADITARRIGRLAAAMGKGGQHTYGRSGKIGR